MADDGNDSDKDKPANGNRSPDGQEGAGKADASERLDAVVFSIARLTGSRWGGNTLRRCGPPMTIGAEALEGRMKRVHLANRRFICSPAF
jgi:hypothetical protein